MSNSEQHREGLLPNTRACLERLRTWRWSDGIACPHCGSADFIKKGVTRKGAQRYRCHGCSAIFNDLTGTVFADHQLSIPEMFYILSRQEEVETLQLSHEVDRTYKSVLNFVHETKKQEHSDTVDAIAGSNGVPKGLASDDAGPSNRDVW